MKKTCFVFILVSAVFLGYVHQSEATDFCVNTSGGFEQALLSASFHGVDDTITLVSATYTTSSDNFSFVSLDKAGLTRSGRGFHLLSLLSSQRYEFPSNNFFD